MRLPGIVEKVPGSHPPPKLDPPPPPPSASNTWGTYVMLFAPKVDLNCDTTLLELYVCSITESVRNIVLCSEVHYSTAQYGTVQYSTVQYSTVQYGTVQYSTVQYSTVQYNTVWYSPVQCSIMGEMYSTSGAGVIVACQNREMNSCNRREHGKKE